MSNFKLACEGGSRLGAHSRAQRMRSAGIWKPFTTASPPSALPTRSPSSPSITTSSPSPRPLPPSPLPTNDMNVELWRSLVLAGGDQLVRNVEEAQQSIKTGVARLVRLAEPAPKGYPPGPSGDQAINLLQDPLKFLQDMNRQYGEVVGLLMGGERVVLVTGKEAARTVMIDAADVFVKKGTAFFPGSSLAGNGLLVSDGDMWKRQRRLSNPAFRQAAVQSYASAMVTATQAMMKNQWAEGGVRDVYADFNELTLRVTLEALFGFSTSSNESSSHSPSTANSVSSDAAEEIVAAVAQTFEFFTRRAASAMVIPEWVPTMDNLEFSAAVQKLDRVVYGLIDERRTELRASSNSSSSRSSVGVIKRTDLMNALMTSVDENGQGMSNRSLRDELMTLLVAGQETSAILLGWTSALMASHPEVQELAAQEVATATDGNSRPPSGEDVRNMKLLFCEAIILEALRLYAPAYMVGRCACKDFMLGEYELKAGTTVLVSPYVMHRDERYWENPDVFNPERWSSIQAAPDYKGFMSLMSNLGPNGMYVPFGAGPRNCIGTGFAMMEGISVLAALLQHYTLKPASASSAFPKPNPMITLRPEEVRLRLVKRK